MPGHRVRIYLLRTSLATARLNAGASGEFKPRPDSLLVRQGLSGDGFWATGDTQGDALANLHDLEMLQ